MTADRLSRTVRENPDPSPLANAALDAIGHADPRELCRAFAALTHRMHAAQSAEFERTLREHRDAVEAEMIRRMELAERLDPDTRDPACDQCCHAPGTHPTEAGS
jgi:hypothetical protein